jgi:hypothetical protein
MMDKMPYQDVMLFEAGQILGILMRHRASDWALAAEAAHLSPEYKSLIMKLSKLRLDVENNDF